MVLYNPDWNITCEAIDSLASQVDSLCIVDNTQEAENSSRFVGRNNIHYIPLRSNKGIAAAQNVGIRYLTDLRFQYILFSDQDTLAPTGIVKELLSDFLRLKENGFNIGLIGPVPVNKTTGKPYASKIPSINKIECDGNQYDECSYIISSFSLIPTQSFKDAGAFREDFFIDFVDNEWCFRLHSLLGLSPFISHRLSILHELGKSQKFLGKQVNISSPFRLYYQIRNYFWIRQLNYVPSAWLSQVRNKLIPKIAYYSIVPKQRFSYIKSILRGIHDGIKTNRNRTKFNPPKINPPYEC